MIITSLVPVFLDKKNMIAARQNELPVVHGFPAAGPGKKKERETIGRKEGQLGGKRIWEEHEEWEREKW